MEHRTGRVFDEIDRIRVPRSSRAPSSPELLADEAYGFQERQTTHSVVSIMSSFKPASHFYIDSTPCGFLASTHFRKRQFRLSFIVLFLRCSDRDNPFPPRKSKGLQIRSEASLLVLSASPFCLECGPCLHSLITHLLESHTHSLTHTQARRNPRTPALILALHSHIHTSSLSCEASTLSVPRGTSMENFLRNR